MLIRINESQKKRLFEAYREGFSFEVLSTIGRGLFAGENNSAAQMRYCNKWLGSPCSNGTSRAVYTLSDNFVLKLAYGDMYEAGIAQNKLECKVFQMANTPLLPRIIHHDKYYTFLVSEHVLPAKEEDFEKVLGIPFYNKYFQNSEKMEISPTRGDFEIGFNKYFDNIKRPDEFEKKITIENIMGYLEENYVVGNDYFDADFENAIGRTPWLQQMEALIDKVKIGDLCSVDNFGLVNRDGKPMIVVLDAGMDMDVLTTHYAK